MGFRRPKENLRSSKSHRNQQKRAHLANLGLFVQTGLSAFGNCSNPDVHCAKPSGFLKSNGPGVSRRILAMHPALPSCSDFRY